MVYNAKEYKPISDTPLKKVQELTIARKIMELLNQNKYNSLEDFYQKNRSYQDFLKNNNMDTVVKHFGNTLNENDYAMIIGRLREITISKQSFDDKDIKTTKIDDKEFNSFKGEEKTYFVDNSNSQKTIEEQMRSLQPTNSKFQSTDAKQNTESMFRELENNVKESIRLQFLNEINVDMLNKNELDLVNAALDYQRSTGHIIRIDLGRGIVVDENDNIKKIEKVNGIYSIKTDEIKTDSNNQSTISYQKQLVMTPNNDSVYNS